MFAFGSAGYHGSVPGDPSIHLAAPIVGIAPDTAGSGYWLVGSDGGVFGFGDALYHGSVPGSPSIHLAAPIVGMADTPDGGGYWLVGSDGGVYSFGDAHFHGSVPGSHSIHLGAPIVGWPPPRTAAGTGWLAPTAGCSASVTPASTGASQGATRSTWVRRSSGSPPRDAGGYWLVGSDGGVFCFGDAAYHGSVPGSHSIHLGAPIVGMAATPDGGGYWLVGSDGGVFGFR